MLSRGDTQREDGLLEGMNCIVSLLAHPNIAGHHRVCGTADTASRSMQTEAVLGLHYLHQRQRGRLRPARSRRCIEQYRTLDECRHPPNPECLTEASGETRRVACQNQYQSRIRYCRGPPQAYRV